MKATVLYGPRDIRFEDRETPRIEQPTDAVIRITATCVCGSDLWPHRGLQPLLGPTPMGHEYCGIVEEVGNAVRLIEPGQFVIGADSVLECVGTRQSMMQAMPWMSVARSKLCCAREWKLLLCVTSN